VIYLYNWAVINTLEWKMASEQILLVLLLLVWAFLDILALVYLFRERKLTWWETGLWGFMALFLPIVGPICVIAGKPGRPRK
jgi:hypothetical protein